MSSGVTASNSHSPPGVSERSFILAAGEVSLPCGERELCVRTRSWLQRFAFYSDYQSERLIYSAESVIQ